MTAAAVVAVAIELVVAVVAVVVAAAVVEVVVVVAEVVIEAVSARDSTALLPAAADTVPGACGATRFGACGAATRGACLRREGAARVTSGLSSSSTTLDVLKRDACADDVLASSVRSSSSAFTTPISIVGSLLGTTTPLQVKRAVRQECVL